MIMKKYVVLMGLMIMSTIIFAQQKTVAPARSEKHGERIRKELALTDDQYKDVKSIDKQFSGKFSELRRDSTLTKEVRNQKMKSLHTEKEAALKKVMTDEQFTKFKDIKTTRAKKFRHAKRQLSGDHALKMQRDLSLSDKQTSKIKAFDKEYGEKLRELRKDSATSKDESRKHYKQLHNEHRTKIKSVLTDEQLQKWEAQRKERKSKKGK